jgi:hypothetical protein
MGERQLRAQVDGLLHRAHEAWQKPEVRRRIKWGAVVLLIVNIIGWSFASYFLTKPNETFSLTNTQPPTAYPSTTGFNGNFTNPTNA